MVLSFSECAYLILTLDARDGVLCRASDKCQREKRKTINGDDLLWAMATLGFEDYIDPLKGYLAKYREVTLFAYFPIFQFVSDWLLRKFMGKENVELFIKLN